MKFLAVILLSSVITTARGNSCLSQNPLLAELQKGGVVVFDKPDLNSKSTACGGLWQTEGACCDQSSLLAFSKKDRNGLEVFVDNMVKTIDAFNEKLKASSTALTNKNINLDFITRFQDTSLSYALGNATRKCWYYMANVRASALCFVCSGKSRKYFINERGAVTPNQCGGVIQACNGYFIQAFRILQGFDTFVNNALKVFPTLISLSPVLKTWASKFDKAAKKFDFLNVMEKLNNKEFNDPMKQNMEIEICNRFFNIVKAPWNRALDRVLQILSDAVPIIFGIFSEIPLPKLLKPVTNWGLLSRPRRLLEALSIGQSPLLQADTQVLLSSSSASSAVFEQPPAAALQSSHSGVDISAHCQTTPMNLSLALY